MNEPPTSGDTRENVTGPRIVAGLIDVIILAILGLAMAAAFGEAGTEDNGFSADLSGLPFVIYVLLSFGYYFLLEYSGGQTVGKRVMRLRVASTDGPLTPGKVAIRTVLRIVDALPFLYLVGLIVVAASRQNQRIGDMAAGTVVIRA